MRRIRLGDVFCIKLTNGYKLLQWAYDIPRRGLFMRVFPGLFDSIPENIEGIVRGEHSYIISARIRRMYRIGLVEFLANYPVPDKYPFPRYNLEICMDQNGKVYEILFLETNPNVSAGQFGFDASSMKELPPEYQEIKLLNGYFSPAFMFYLFDYDFDLKDLSRFRPQNVLGDTWKEKLDEYIRIVETAETNAKEKQ